MIHRTRTCVAVTCVVVGLLIGIIGGAVAASGWRGSRWESFWPVYLCYMGIAGAIGIASPGWAWLAGLVIMPAHWLWIQMSGVETGRSTIAVGQVLTFLASIPLTLAACVVGGFTRSRRESNRPVEPPGK